MHDFKYLLVHQTTKRNSYVDSQYGYSPTDKQINFETSTVQNDDRIYENDTNGN